MDQNIKVAVIGGTGKAGKYLVRQLAGEGFNTRVLTRDPKKLYDAGLTAETVTGDARNYESVYTLINGCDVVVSTLGQTKGEDPVFSVAAKNIIKAMDALKLKRYIVLTGLTLYAQSDKKGFQTRMKSLVMKLLFGRIIADKQKEFELLQESDLDYTIVRVPFIELTESRKSIGVSLEDCRGSGISSADLAAFLVDQISNKSFIRKAPFIWNS